MSPDELALITSLRDPDDRPLTMLAYSDILKEQGDENAALGVDWARMRGRFPTHDVKMRWAWTQEGDWKVDEPHDLPKRVFRRLKNKKSGDEAVWYGTIREAFSALGEAISPLIVDGED